MFHDLALRDQARSTAQKPPGQTDSAELSETLTQQLTRPADTAKQRAGPPASSLCIRDSDRPGSRWRADPKQRGPDLPDPRQRVQAGVGMAERLQCSAAPVRLVALLPGRGTTHVIFKAAPKTGFRKRTLRFGGPRRLPASARARRPGSLKYNMLLCHLRRLHCHGNC